MENLKRVKEDLIGALITLGVNSLSDKDKIKECDKILLEIIAFIDPIIINQEKKEIYESVASDILSKKHYNNRIIREEYRDGDVWFEFYRASHDYSAGRDTDTITKTEIEKELLLRRIRYTGKSD